MGHTGNSKYSIEKTIWDIQETLNNQLKSQYGTYRKL